MPVRITSGNIIDDTLSLYHMTYQSVGICADEAFNKTGLLHQQYQVLRAIKDISGQVTPTVIANWLDRKPNSITLIIDRMEKRGLVKRLRDMKDRRAIRLAITPKGEKLYSKPAPELPKEVLSALTEEELRTFKELLYKIREKTFEIRDIKDKVTDIHIARAE